MPVRAITSLATVLCLAGYLWSPTFCGATVEQQLAAEPTASLAAAAARDGDAARGAKVFFRAEMACHRCHVADMPASTGPDLTRLNKTTSDQALVESVLAPSKTIAAGFQASLLELRDGRTLIGIVRSETPDTILLCDASQPGVELKIPKHDIETRTALAQSIMPGGQVNQLSGRQEFLDLIRYLIELRDGGSQRARQLQPATQLLAVQIPAYEADVDHAGLIGSWGDANYDRGAAIYGQVCANCHGTEHQPGSLPTALRFSSGKFKAGSDPYSMYRTLTHGFGMMTPQTWMVPQQKYDVIYYIREELLKRQNQSQFFEVTKKYLAGLPRGTTRGPEPKKNSPWTEMNYGPALTNVYEFGNNDQNLAYKGIAVRLDSGPGGVTHGNRWMVFDHDTLRVAAGWHGQGFIDFAGIQFDGRHVVHAHAVGKIDFVTASQPGWARAGDGSFEDPRIKGTDGKQYGPLPGDWGRFRGLYYHGQQVVLAYTVGQTDVLELPSMAGGDSTAVFTRTLNIAPRQQDMVLQVAQQPRGAVLHTPDASDGKAAVAIVQPRSTGTARGVVAGVSPCPSGVSWSIDGDGNLRLRIPKGSQPLRFTVWIGAFENPADVKNLSATKLEHDDRDLAAWTHGGPPRWPERLETQPIPGTNDGPFAVDVLTHPALNPWHAQMRLTGLDFLPDGDQAAVCSWDGDVWLVSGLSKAAGPLSWQRIASGLFQPLGLKVVQGRIFVTCRDQIVILNDLNGDGETDYYECFNSDHQVTAHFHEFAMGLQADAAGNLYYAKAACHARPALVPQHGTLLRVSPDGLKTDILARGFRAPNGVCLNPDGTFFMTDQEGHWLPKNRINRVVPGKFYGNMMAAGAPRDSSDKAMEQPVCWITNAFDRSPAEMLWVDSKVWGPLQGSLLNLSYGYGKIFVVPHENVGGQWQGGMCELPLPMLPTGIIRGRFHPQDGQLYACGMYAWAGDRTLPGGLYRIRATGKPPSVPVGLKARQGRLEVTLSDPLDASSVAELKNYAVRVWSLKRTANYGSPHLDEHALEVTGAKLASDGRTIVLAMPKLAPTWCMEIKYSVKGKNGAPVMGKIHNTIHRLEQ